MLLVVFKIAHTMVRETCLPHGRVRFQAIRKSSFEELHGPLQRNLLSGRQQRVEVVGHDHEFVEQKFSFVAIVRQRFDHKVSRCLPAKDWTALGGDGRDEEDAIGVQFAIVVEVGECCLCQMSQFAARDSKTVHGA